MIREERYRDYFPLVVGVDPGPKSGMICRVMCSVSNVQALLDGSVENAKPYSVQTWFETIPTLENGELCAFSFRDIISDAYMVVIEKQQVYPGQGAVSGAKLVGQYQAMRAIAEISPVDKVFLVHPKSWLPYFSLGPDKEDHRVLAQYEKARLGWGGSSDFSLKKDHDKADAFLLALFGLHRCGGYQI